MATVLSGLQPSFCLPWHCSFFRHCGTASVACRGGPTHPFCEATLILTALADLGDLDYDPPEMVAGSGFRSRVLVGSRNRPGVRPSGFLALSRNAPPGFDPERVHPGRERRSATDFLPPILLGPVLAYGGRPALEWVLLLEES